MCKRSQGFLSEEWKRKKNENGCKVFQLKPKINSSILSKDYKHSTKYQ